MAVSLGYKNVYRDPYGFPKWQEHGLPITSTPAGLSEPVQVDAGPAGSRALQGWAMLWTLLGIVAALTGGLMGALLQNPIVLTLVAGVLIVFATSLFGLWELRLPGALTQRETGDHRFLCRSSR